MNLLARAWISFLSDTKEVSTGSIVNIIDKSIVDFQFPRPDFQGAAYQLVIGVLQTVIAPEDDDEWCEYYNNPPSMEQLEEKLQPILHAFNMVGSGPLFMQDFDELEQAKPSPVESLFIDSPGENTLKKNADHFIKRGRIDNLSLEMAALALFTLQINAPSGGQGHRTGLRGGGPLTTLILPNSPNATLWQKLWLNVMPVPDSRWQVTQDDVQSNKIFPWLKPTKTSEKKGSEIFVHDVHPLHMYWAMPRRIRLEVDAEPSVCSVLGSTTEHSVSHFRSVNYGHNYSGDWSHPLTPYKWDLKKENSDRLSIKGQPGGINCKNWSLLALSSDNEGQAAAKVVENFSDLSVDLNQPELSFARLWAFGYDMDNMKARCWYSSVLPLWSVPPSEQELLLLEVRRFQTLSEEALALCKTTIKEARFNRPKDAKGDMSFININFWQKIEPAFFSIVQAMLEKRQNSYQVTTDEAELWLKQLRQLTISLFDQSVLSAIDHNEIPDNAIKARNRLTGWLHSRKTTSTVAKFKHTFSIVDK